MRHRAQQFVQYHQHVLETAPIAYWRLDEKQGTVAYEQVAQNGAQNGTHTGVTLYQPGIGDGTICPYYDGANDYTSIWSAALVAAFNGSEGTALAWARVANIGVWSDGANRMVMQVRVDANNRFFLLRRGAVNNQIFYVYNAGGVSESVALGGLTTLDWMQWGLTWSASAGANGEVRAYYNGAQTGATQVALGAWAGAPIAADTNIGCSDNTVPADLWHGWLAHGALWDRPLSPAEIYALYRAGRS